MRLQLNPIHAQVILSYPPSSSNWDDNLLIVKKLDWKMKERLSYDLIFQTRRTTKYFFKKPMAIHILLNETGHSI